MSSRDLDLVGTWEAAEILGVERPRIGRWLKPWRDWKDGTLPGQGGPMDGPEPDIKIPKPDGANGCDLRGGPVWRRRVIEEFAAQREQAAA